MTRWRIEELSEHIRVALADFGVPANGQVSAVPSKRTIRYYTTLGLLDAPAEMKGRTAYYDERHLLQLLAIKQLQQRGCSLAEVQEKIAGADDVTLRALTGTEIASPASRTESPRRADAFWAAPPPPSPQVRSKVAAPDDRHAPRASKVAATFTHTTQVVLGNGMTLHVPGALDADAVAQIVASAQPFVQAVAPLLPAPLPSTSSPDDGERVSSPSPESSTTKGDTP